MGIWHAIKERVPRVRANMGKNQLRPRSGRGRVTTVLVCALAGLMMTVAALAARGTDLRADRTADLRDLIVSQGQRNAELRSEADQLREEVATLGSSQVGTGDIADDLDRAESDAGMTAVAGPGLQVTLTDAPNEVKPPGVDDDALVVHQQDIQAVTNALWAGGAEAMTIQGQRVVATTGVKCVGNTVVLHGIPYAPPYVIQAIGDQDGLQASLDASAAIQIYKQYVEAYGLGYSVERSQEMGFPAFSGSTGIDLARVAS